ncbi:MAG: gfo/Idh/MocA family oxidoreductase, partial [Chloroflexi bacterium]
MSKKIGFGIVGCGGIAHDAHLPSLKEIPEAKVVAISRRREKEARRIAEEFGVENWYTDNNQVIEHDDVDAVIICTPPN